MLREEKNSATYHRKQRDDNLCSLNTCEKTCVFMDTCLIETINISTAVTLPQKEKQVRGGPEPVIQVGCFHSQIEW